MPARGPGRARLPIAGLFLGGWLVGAADTVAATQGHGDAHAVTIASKSADMSLPVRDGVFNLGDAPVRIASDNTIVIQRAAFLSVIKPILRPETLNELDKILPAQEFVDTAQITRSGLSCHYNPAELVLTISPTVEQRPRGEITGSLGSQAVESSGLAKRAAASGYINMQFGASYNRSGGEPFPMVAFPAAALDGAARFGDVVIEGEADADWGGQVWRRGTRAIYDLPDEAIRLTAGDLSALGGSDHILPPLLGINIERSFQKLQPTRNIRPTGRRSFRVERPSEIEVLLNGTPIRRLKLAPGEYDLDQLPLAGGSNDIQLIITDDTGREEKLDFAVLFDRSLLAVGLSEWSFSAGFASGVSDTLLYDYAQPYTSAAYRLGLTEQLTGELAVQAGGETVTVDASALWQTPVGLLHLETAASISEQRAPGWFGVADLDVALDEEADLGALNLGLEMQTADYVLPGGEHSTKDPWLRASGSYSRSLGSSVTGALSARYAFAAENEDDAFSVGLSLTRNLGEGMSMSLSGNYGSARQPDDHNALLSGLSVFGRFSYRLTDSATLALGYDASKQRLTARGTAVTGNGVGDWSTGVEFTRAPRDGEDAENAVEASLGYVGNRFQINTSHSRDFTRPSDMRHVHHSAALGTAIAFADGKVAMGRPVRGAYALVDKHPALTDSKLRMSPSENGDAAESDGLGPLIVSDISAYAQTRIAYDVDEVPDGYDIGNGSYDFVAPYKAGYGLTVGSGATVMVLGNLRDASGKPLKLLSGVAFEKQRPDQKITLFTNAAGHFGAQGFGPGEWQIEISAPGNPRYAFSLVKDAVGMTDVGTLQPIQ